MNNWSLQQIDYKIQKSNVSQNFKPNTTLTI